MSQQDPPDLAALRREVVISTLATAVHRWHRQRVRAGALPLRPAPSAHGEHDPPHSPPPKHNDPPSF